MAACAGRQDRADGQNDLLDLTFWYLREVSEARGHGSEGQLGCPLQGDVLVNQQHVCVVA